MAEFKYKARDSRGRMKSGKISASSRESVKASLIRMRYRPVYIRAVKLDTPEDGEKRKFIYRDEKGKIQIVLSEPKPTTKDLIVFTKQFATMINSGVPLIQALGILASQQRVRSFGRCLDKVRFAVENGATLSDALEAYPNLFDSLYIAMVRAGEASGNLDSILLKLVGYIEKSAKIKSQVKSAMMYPTIVVVVAVAVVGALLVFVVPTFAKQYIDQGKELPALTQMVIDMSNFAVDYWYMALASMFVLTAVVGRYVKTEAGRAWFDGMMLRLPGFGQLFRKVAVGRFCNTMSTMLTAGVNMLDALTICAASSGNKILEKFVLNVRGAVEQGGKMSEALNAGELFPAMVVSMVAVGETTGTLDEMLIKVSEFYEDEVDMAIKTLLSMIEPVMIVGIGGFVGFIVIAMYLPVFDMASLVGQ